MSMPYETLLAELDSKIAVITLNRPNRRNALSLKALTELIACLDEVGQDKTIQVVILAAAGPAYSAGHDLTEMTGRSVGEYREIFDVCTNLMTKIQSIPQPVIAEVQGI